MSCRIKNSLQSPPPRILRANGSDRAFTLIELSIVLVIIGLIVGGILVGRDLIAASGIRAQISQIDKYRQAAYTFRDKYGFLPGDIPEPSASQFGFKSRTGNLGWGNGDGIVSGTCGGGGVGCGYAVASGETTMFWGDLSVAQLIEGNFTATTPGVYPSSITDVSPYFPPAKIGRGNYIYVWSGGYYATGALYPGDGQSYFGLSAVTSIGSAAWFVNSTPMLTVAEAYAIDSKIDDGLPQSGRVQAFYINYADTSGLASWAAGGGGHGANIAGSPATNAYPASSTTCYDNGGLGGIQKYSVAYNNGAGLNCAVSFRLQ